MQSFHFGFPFIADLLLVHLYFLDLSLGVRVYDYLRHLFDLERVDEVGIELELVQLILGFDVFEEYLEVRAQDFY